MKELSLLMWIGQLGLSFALPVAGFTLLGVWLRGRTGAGAWLIALFCMIGLISGAHGCITVLRQLDRQQRQSDKNHPGGFDRHE